MFGVLNINKPLGMTSRDAVDRVQRLVRPIKVGHAGTLDPLAQGVLVVCIGQATRLIEYVQQMPKQYRATFLLGQSSPSDDLETPVEFVADATIPTAAEIDAALPQFTGAISQRPPAYSAVKIAGKRAYKLARRGAELELAERPVHIHRLSVLHYEFPELELEMTTGSGVYVRSLGRDLAESLGTRGVMSSLIRAAIGEFRIEDAMDLQSLDKDQLTSRLQSPLAAVAQLPRLALSQEQAELVARGGLIPTDSLSGVDGASLAEAGAMSAVDRHGRLVAILKPARPGLLRPSPNFSQSE